MNTEKMVLLANELIDYLCELNGVEWVIEYLFSSGFGYNELADLGFNELEIKKVASDIGIIL